MSSQVKEKMDRKFFHFEKPDESAKFPGGIRQFIIGKPMPILDGDSTNNSHASHVANHSSHSSHSSGGGR